jgi:hypothetical protein
MYIVAGYIENIKNRSKAERFFLCLSIFIFTFDKQKLSTKRDLKMENWAEGINLKIDAHLENVREKDIRFFRVEEFKRNILRIEEFSSECSFCKNQKDDIAYAVELLHEAIQVPGKSRRKYDRLISRLSKHMQKEHGFYAPYYFSYIYAFFGLLTGAVSGFVLSTFFPSQTETIYLVAFMVCIVGTYFLGSNKDKKIRSAKKIM